MIRKQALFTSIHLPLILSLGVCITYTISTIGIMGDYRTCSVTVPGHENINSTDVLQWISVESDFKSYRDQFLNLLRSIGGLSELQSYVNTLYPSAPSEKEALYTFYNNLTEGKLFKVMECCQVKPQITESDAWWFTAFGCPRGEAVCVKTPQARFINRKRQVVQLGSSGCCPIEASQPIFSIENPTRLAGCCKENQVGCFTELGRPKRWLGCADNITQCCNNMICPKNYGCCRNPNLSGLACCPLYGASCFNINPGSGVLTTAQLQSEADAVIKSVNMETYFGKKYGYHSCLPIIGGLTGAVTNIMPNFNTTAGKALSDTLIKDSLSNCYESNNPVDNTVINMNLLTRPALKFLIYLESPKYNGSLEDVYYDYIGQFVGDNVTGITNNITFDTFLDNNGTLPFIECGATLCYPGDTCVYRTKNRTSFGNATLLNFTAALSNSIKYSTDYPYYDPLWLLTNLSVIGVNVTMCEQYNQTYLDYLISLYGDNYTAIENYIPTNCIIYPVKYFIEKRAVGCCPANTTPCGAERHSFGDTVNAEWPRSSSLSDPLVTCAGPGEECCGLEGKCTVGYKCCHHRMAFNGGLDPAYPDHESSGSLTGTFLNAAMDLTKKPPNTTRIPGIIDKTVSLTPMCCPSFTTCCQMTVKRSDITFGDPNSFNGQLYYCSVDPLCKIPHPDIHAPLFQNMDTSNGAMVTEEGFPSPLFGEFMDYNSDGNFSEVDDILNYFSNKNPEASVLTPDYVDYSTTTFPFSLTIDENLGGPYNPDQVVFVVNQCFNNGYQCSIYFTTGSKFDQESNQSSLVCSLVQPGTPKHNNIKPYDIQDVSSTHTESVESVTSYPSLYYPNGTNITVTLCGNTLTIPVNSTIESGNFRTYLNSFIPAGHSFGDYLFLELCFNITDPRLDNKYP